MMKGGDRKDAGILCQMQGQERDERPESHHHEKWQACHPGNMPDLWDQDVPYWQGLTLVFNHRIITGGYDSYRDPPFIIYKNHYFTT